MVNSAEQRKQLLETVQAGTTLQLRTELTSAHYYSVVAPTAEGGVVGMSLDITHLEQAWSKHYGQQLEQQRAELLSEFMRSAAHDIRTPLSILKTSLYLFKRTTDPERQTERINIMETTLNNLNDLIENMFLMIRIDTLSIYEKRPLSLEALLTSLTHERKALAETGNVTLTHDILSPLPELCGHGTYLLSALGEFLDNAFQYTPHGGSITVSAKSNDDHIMIGFEDSGCGIEPQDLPHIYERFYRAEKHRHIDEHIHSGLGLSRAKKIIEKHGGSISVKSTPGEGALFTVILPHSSNCADKV